MLGGIVSTTVTVNCALAVFWRESLAVHLTSVVPMAKTAPEAGVHDTGTGPSIVSVAVTAYLTTVDTPVASMIMLDGVLMAGGVVSSTGREK
jgi:hypothetical protein